jgi:hypothetical protein
VKETVFTGFQITDTNMLTVLTIFVNNFFAHVIHDFYPPFWGIVLTLASAIHYLSPDPVENSG